MSLLDLRSIYIANGLGIFILLMLRYASRAKILRDHPEDRVYNLMVYGVMIGCFFEAFSYTIDGHVFACSRILNYAANTYLYSFNLLLSLCVLIYVDLGLYGDTRRIWKRYKPHIIIAAVMIALNFVNYFVPVIYTISPQNEYSRTPLSYSYYVSILFFLISAAVLNRRYEKENGARSFFNINVFILPIILGAGLQFAFYGLSLAWLSAAVGLVGLYMMQQNELAYVDPLVDTYNRQYLNHIVSAWTSRGHSFAGCMFDLDDFKSINDTYGHSEGDNVLKAITRILKSSRQENEWVFRYAGDEFMVLKLTPEPDGLDAYMEEVKKELAEHNRLHHPIKLSLSYGRSFCDNDDIDSFLKDMDKRMYEMKAEHHRSGQQSS